MSVDARHRFRVVTAALPLMVSAVAAPVWADDFFDRLGDTLSVSSAEGKTRARLSGSVELEGYYQSEPVSDLIFSEKESFINPRLSLFLDVQLGSRWYAFAQARVDRGFDPTDDGSLGVRVEEYAVRFSSPDDGRLNFQVGQFATVVGNWSRRHTAWENPFVTAPLPYDNLTGMWDGDPVTSARTLLAWAHVQPVSSGRGVYEDKHQRLPIVWGPSYATGAAISGASGPFEYAIEVKNASLSSRPQAWNHDSRQWRHPTVSGRLGWRPNPAWNIGLNASSGSYLRPEAGASLGPGRGLAEYRQLVLAHDVAFAWRHVQLWAELYAARFEIPGIGEADTYAYYVEAKYKFTPQFSGAVRWNQQGFGRVANERMKWGRDVWRIDVAPTYRFTPHIQLKLQFSLRHEAPAVEDLTHSAAAQLTVKF
jgi:hypothetical protein